MPFVTFAERYGREMGEIDGRKEGHKEGQREGQREGRYEAIEVALDLRFPDALAELMPRVKQIADMDRLHALLLLAKRATLADIQAAVASPPA